LDNKFGDEGAKELLEGIKSNVELKTLDLRDNKISENILQTISDEIKLNNDPTERAKKHDILFQKKTDEEIAEVLARRNPVGDKWTPLQTSYFISSFPELSIYSEKFTTEHITGEVLIGLTEDDLKNSIGIQILGHRRTLLNEIQRLKNPDQSNLKSESEFQKVKIEITKLQDQVALAINTINAVQSQLQGKKL